MDLFDLGRWNKNYQGIHIDQVVIDSRRITSNKALFVALKGKQQDGALYVEEAIKKGASFAIVSNEAKLDVPEEMLIRTASPLATLQKIATAYRRDKRATVIAIGGSVGKTMTKDLLSLLLEKRYRVCSSPESFNSQIGAALSLFRIKETDEFALIEAAATNEKEAFNLAKMILPDALILTNLQTKFLDQEEFEKALLKLAEEIPSNGLILAPSQFSHPRTVPYETGFPLATLNEKQLIVQFNEKNHFVIQAKGGYNYLEPLFTLCLKAANIFNIPEKTIKETLLRYEVEPTRVEIFKVLDNLLVVNDRYGSDVSSLQTSLNWFHQEKRRKNILFFRGLKDEEALPEQELLLLSEQMKSLPIDALILEKNAFTEKLAKLISSSPLPYPLHIEECASSALKRIKRLEEPSTLLIKGKARLDFDFIITTLKESPLSSVATINLAFIEENIRRIRKHRGIPLMVMVKALGYGTDETRIANFLFTLGIDLLGVSYIDEAIELRKKGIKQNLFVLHCPPYEAFKASLYDFEIGVSSIDEIKALEHFANKQGKILNLHLHLDTGMGRLGCHRNDVLELAEYIQSSPSLCLHGFMTHFAAADDPSMDEYTNKQYAMFLEGLEQVKKTGGNPKWIHAANSQGLLRFSLTECTMARVGLSIFGLQGTSEEEKRIPLISAVSLRSKIVGFNTIDKGESVSYGRTYIAKETMKVAVVPLGYFDGIPRALSNKGFVLVHGQKAPIVGSVCMDYFMIDVTLIESAAVGDTVSIFGYDEKGTPLPIQSLAEVSKSISHQILCGLGPRIQRVFIHEESSELFKGRPEKQRLLQIHKDFD